MEEDVKLCKDCKWCNAFKNCTYEVTDGDGLEIRTDYVNGGKIIIKGQRTYNNCDWNRSSSWKEQFDDVICGTEGRWFEPKKHGIFKRIFSRS